MQKTVIKTGLNSITIPKNDKIKLDIINYLLSDKIGYVQLHIQEHETFISVSVSPTFHCEKMCQYLIDNHISEIVKEADRKELINIKSFWNIFKK